MTVERNEHHTHFQTHLRVHDRAEQHDDVEFKKDNKCDIKAQSCNSIEARCGTSRKEKSSFPSFTRRPSSSSTIVQLSTVRWLTALSGATVGGVRNKNGMAESSESVSGRKSSRGHEMVKSPLEPELDIAPESDGTSSGVPVY